jgi:hypothetical protein
MSRKIKPAGRATTRPIVLIGLALVAIVGAVLVFGATRTTPQQSEVVQHATAPHFVDVPQQDHHAVTSARTIVIARLGETLPHISGAEGPLMTTLVRGQLPDGVTKATVRTDENCAADAEGVSHCLNELDLGTVKVTVQHHHDMSITSCLTPGETVSVMTAAQYQARS